MIDDFRRSLGETIAWTRYRLEKGDEIKFPGFYFKSDEEPSLERMDDDQRRDLISKVVEERRARLDAAGLSAMTEGLYEGRLLLLNIEGTLGDGISGPMTNGFLNYEDLSASDTWISFFEGSENFQALEEIPEIYRFSSDGMVLASYVPKEFIHGVSGAIISCLTNQLAYANQVTSESIDVLKKEGLIRESSDIGEDIGKFFESIELEKK